MFDTVTRLGASGGEGEYEIAKSLRFNDDDSPYLTRDPSSATNRRTFTFSFWTKLGPTAATSGNACLFSVGGNSITQGFFELRFGAAGFRIRSNTGGGAGGGKYWATTAKYKDVSKWYHCVCAVDTTLGTATDRIKFYINGVRESDIIDSGDSYTDEPAEDFEFLVNNNQIHAIGYGKSSGGSVDGYTDQLLAEWHFIDGSALTPDNFGKTKVSTGEWIPIEYTGSHGTNGYYLSFGDTSALGNDDSSNSNNWTPNNFSVSAGPGNDSLTDTPTSNYCVLDCLDVKDSIITDGNLSTATTEGGGHQPNFSTIAVTSGKWYVEGRTISGTSSTICVWPKDHDGTSLDQDCAVHNTGSLQNAKGYGLNLQYGSASDSDDATISSYVGTSFTVWMLALDLDNNKIWWGVDGTWGNNGGTGNPATGANPAFSSIRDELWAIGSMTTSGHNVSFNFGQQAFSHTPPTGFLPITTQNLPEPTIKDGTKYFNTVLYTGNGTDDRTVSGVGFDPDLVWIKNRSSTNWHNIADTVTGITWNGNTNSRDAFGNNSNIKTTNSDGFTLGTHATVNGNTLTYVAWNWLESSTAGFDIVTYEGTGANRTVSHGLGVKPDLIIGKNIDQDNQEWGVYHKDIGATKAMFLDDNSAGLTNSIFFNNTEPTSSVFTVGTADTMNGDGDTCIAYLFSNVEGYSKFGYYYGNGAKEGPIIYTGFRPAWVLVKNTEETSVWNLHDSVRDTYNPVNAVIYPNTNDDEESYAIGTDASTNKNFFANGFQIYSTHDPELNANDEKYIYIAFADRPFKYANTR